MTLAAFLHAIEGQIPNLIANRYRIERDKALLAT
jgi:hypothetical protein